MVSSHVINRFGDLDDTLGAPISRLQRGDREVRSGEGGKAAERQLCGPIEEDEVIVSAHFGNEIDQGQMQVSFLPLPLIGEIEGLQV